MNNPLLKLHTPLLVLATCLVFFSCGRKDRTDSKYSGVPAIMVPVGHTTDVTNIEFNPDGQLMLTSSDDGTAKLWDVKSGRLIYTLLTKSNIARFSPDGKWIATGGDPALWDVATGKQHHQFGRLSGPAVYLDFSKDGKFLVTSSMDYSAIAWETQSGKLLDTLQKPVSGQYNSISGRNIQFSPDGNFILVTVDSIGHVFNSSFEHLHSFPVYKYASRPATFSHSQNQIVAVDVDGLRIVDAKSGEIIRTIADKSEYLESVDISPDDNLIVVAGDTTTNLWDSKNGKLIAQFSTGPLTVQALFSPDGSHFAAGNQGNKGVSTMTVWKANPVKLLYTIDEGSDSWLEGVGMISAWAFSPDGKYFANAFRGVIRVRETTSGKLIQTIKGIQQKITSSKFCDDGTKVISAETFNPQVIDLLSGSLANRPIATTGLLTMAVSKDGSKVATTYGDSTIRIWKSSTGSVIHSIKADTYFKYSAFSPAGNYLVCLDGADHTYDVLYLIDSKSGKLIRKIKTRYYLDALSFSPDATRLAISSHDTLDVIDISSNKNICSAVDKAVDKEVHSIEFTRDNSMFFSSGQNKSIIWNSSGDSLLRVPAYLTRLMKDDKLFVGASQELAICKTAVYETKSGDLVKILSKDSIFVREIHASPDGEYLLTVSDSVRIYKTATWNKSFSYKLTGLIEDINWSRGYVLQRNRSELSLIDFRNSKVLLSWHFVDSTDFVVTSPSGLFDASPGAMNKLYFVQGLDIIDFSQLKERYYEPGLWKKVMSGEKLRDVSKFSAIDLPPDLTNSEVTEANTTTITITNRDGGIGQAVVLVNGLEVIEDLRPSGFNPKSKSWSTELKLASLPNLKKGEENLVEVRAWNEGHWVISRPLAIRFTPPATRGVEDVEVTDVKKKKNPSIFILTVGVSDYQGDKIDLKYAAKDAEAMTTTLGLGARKLFGTDSTFVYSLTDNSDLKPTKENIKKTFAEIGGKSSPNDVFVVYLSGHGINWGGDDGDFYYLTKDAYSTSLEAYNDPGIRSNATISSKELIELFKTVPSDKRVLIIDACASGKMVQNLIASRDIESSTLKALDRMRDRTGFHIITGCAADAVSYEASRFGQGVLTYSLIEGIKGPALKDHKSVDVNLLFQHARERVPVLARGIGGIQSPQVFSPAGAQSFDIGILDEETKSKIPLAKTRPVYVRSMFVSGDTFDDSEKISGLLNESLNDLSSKGERAPLLFMDIEEFDDACHLSGVYRKVGTSFTLTYRIRCGKADRTKTVSANGKEKLIELLMGELSK